ncbi:unnamed protein product [Mytilus edulis]|uniref:Endonuclease/exonuclease/phosphatase domain-containing protein n=1 Tax=Mytilus edulis TaxID=6550 RepID=A0A8S3Q635_MYTED|nr:unnamed protein product [Mytilus edulis]
MNQKKDGNGTRKRKNSKDQNISGEKPQKQKQTKKSSTHKVKNVNKQSAAVQNKIDPILPSTSTMTSYDSCQMIQGKQNMQHFIQPQQNFASPVFQQMSPMSGYYPVPSQSPSHSMPPPIMQSTLNQGSESGDKIDFLVQKVEEIFKKLSSIDELTKKIGNFEISVKSLTKTVEKGSKRIDEVEKSMEFMNQNFESSKSESEYLKTTITEIKSEHGEMINGFDCLRADMDELHERHVDLQIRSMRENLVFSGIPELSENEPSEQTEDIIKDFMKTNMKMDIVMDFQRAHRFGKKTQIKIDDRDTYMTRPIVCRFKNFKDRELVRSFARNLKDTKFGVNEQFPKEVNDRRKLLWPYYKEAKKQGQKTHFKRDKLFINGKEIGPPTDRHMETDKRQKETEGARQKEPSRRGPQQNNDRPRGAPHGTNSHINTSINYNHVNKDIVHLLSLNVCGLKRKLLYQEFRDLLKCNDLLCLTETKLDDLDEINFEDFTFHYKNRKKITSFRSGGIALGYRSQYAKFIHCIETDCPFVLWFRVDRILFRTEDDIIMGIVYIPPENTRYTSENAMSEIEIEFLELQKNSNCIFLLGDFNSRTANEQDFFNISDFEEHLTEFIDVNEFNDIHVLDDLKIPRIRNSSDTVVNSYGRKLIQFCKNNNMYILNGRVGKDRVHDIHAPLCLSLTVNGCNATQGESEVINDKNVHIGKWKHEKTIEYKNNIDVDKVNELLLNVISKYDDISSVDQGTVDSIVSDITTVLLSAAKDTFRVFTKNSKTLAGKEFFKQRLV